MRKNIFRITAGVMGVLATLFILSGLFGWFDMSWLASGGVTFAMAASGAASQDPVTTEVTDDKSSELLTPFLDKQITLMRPDKYPFDTILREIGAIKTAPAWKTEYYEVEDRDIEDTVHTTLAASGGSTAQWGTHDLLVNKIHIWQIDDLALVQGVVGSDSKELILHVVNKDISAGKLVVEAVNGTGTNSADVPEIAKDVALTFIGNAKSELDAQTTPYSTFPQKAYNYNQIHMAQVEQGFYEALHSKEVKWNLADYSASALYTMRGSMEFTSLFGFRNKLYDSVGGDYKYMSGGARRYITEVIQKAASGFDNDDWVDVAKTAFTGNNGSDTRVLFAGSGMRATLAKAPSIQKQMEQRDVEVIWGVKFNRVETDFGTFLVKLHKGLDSVGYTNKGFILDMQNIEKHVFDPISTNKIDNNASGTKKSIAHVIDETFCTVYKNPDTHKIFELT